MPSNGEGEHLLISQIGRPNLYPSTLLKLVTPLENIFLRTSTQLLMKYVYCIRKKFRVIIFRGISKN